MELFGIVLSFPVTAAAIVIYTMLANFLVENKPVLRKYFRISAIVVLIIFLAEVVAVWRFGVIVTRQWIGQTFLLLHGILFFLTAPSLVNLMLSFPKLQRKLPVIMLVCFVAAMLCVFWNISVQEQIEHAEQMGILK